MIFILLKLIFSLDYFLEKKFDKKVYNNQYKKITIIEVRVK